MENFFWVVNRLGDLMTAPFAWGSAIFDLVVVSFFCAFFLLLIFKHFSNQERIKFHRSKIFGYFLEIGIYRDQFGRTLSNHIQILKHSLIYLRYVLPPFLMMMIPVLIVCMQIENRLGYLPIRMNKSFIIHAALDSEITQKIDSTISGVDCKTSTGIVLETPPLRIVSNGGVYWRARLTETGPQFVKVTIDGIEDVVEKKINAGDTRERFGPIKAKVNSLHYLFNTAERPIPSSSYFKFLSVNYLPATYPFFFWDVSPVIYFFILSLGFGLALKPFMKVNI
jgi:hypothetical protein